MPNWLQKIAKAFSPREYLRGSIRITEAMGAHGEKHPAFNRQLAVDQFCSWVYICARLNADRVASIPLRLYVRTRTNKTKVWRTRKLSRARKHYLSCEHAANGEYPSAWAQQKFIEYGDEGVEEVTEPHPVLELLRTVNPYANGWDMTAIRMLYLQVTGDCFVHPVMDKNLQRPTGLWIMPSQWTRIKPSRERFIEGYVYGRSAAEQIDFEPDEVIHWKLPNLSDLHYGRGHVEALWSALGLHAHKRMTDLAHYENRARPDWLVIVKQGAGAEQIARWEDDVNKKLRGSEKQGRMFAISGDVEPMRLQFPEHIVGDPDIVLEEICATFGVPITKVKANDPNRANAETGDAGWHRDTVLPLCRMDEQKLNEQLLPLFGIQDDAFLAYDNPVPRDTRFELERRTQLSMHGLMTLDEARAEDGLDEYPDGLGESPRFNGIPLDEIGQGLGFGLGLPGMGGTTQQPAGSAAPTPARQQRPGQAAGQPAAASDTQETAANLQTGEKLNGAQIAASVDVLTQLRIGNMAATAARELLSAVGIDENRAQLMVSSTTELPPLKLPPNETADLPGIAGQKAASGMSVSIPSDGGFAVNDEKSVDDKRGAVIAPLWYGDVTEMVWDVQQSFGEDDRTDKGIEYEPHITVKYGFTTDRIEDIIAAARGIGPMTATLGSIEKFQAQDHDVVYVAVDSDDLRAANEQLSALPNDDAHGKYTPHLTIAYLKPGTADHLIGDTRFAGMELAFNTLQINSRRGERTTVRLNTKNCGIGPDGFEFGNDCAAGGGGGGESDTTVEQGGSLLSRLRRDGGFTYNVVSGESPTSGFVVSANKANEQIVSYDKLSHEALRDYIESHFDDLQKPGMHFGAWDAKDEKQVYLDTVEVVQDRDEAIERGRQLDERAIYDLGEQTEIAIEQGKGRPAKHGTGEGGAARRRVAPGSGEQDRTRSNGEPEQVNASQHQCGGCDDPMPITFKGWKQAQQPGADPGTPVDETGDAEDSQREGEPQNPIEQFSSDMARALDAARKIIIERLAALRGPAVNGKAKSKRVKVSGRDIDDILDDVFGDMREAIAIETREALRTILGAGGAQGMDRINKPIDAFDVTNPAVDEFVSEYTIRLADAASTTTINSLRPQLVEAAQQGMSNQSIIELLESDTSGLFTPERANVIARTESARAFVQGERESWKQSGVVAGVEWLLAPNACEFCRSIAAEFEGKSIGFDEQFAARGSILQGVEGGRMKLDYESITGPPLHPNCRCGLNPVIAE